MISVSYIFMHFILLKNSPGRRGGYLSENRVCRLSYKPYPQFRGKCLQKCYPSLGGNSMKLNVFKESLEKN